MIATRLDRYIFGRTAFGVGAAAGGFCVAILLVDLVEQMRALAGLGEAVTATALRFSLMRLPGILEQALPFAVLTGTITTFLALTRRSEVTAMRAAGVSAWRFLAPAALLSALLGLIVVFALGPASLRLNALFEAERDALSAAAVGTAAEGTRQVWMKGQSTNARYLMQAQASGEPGTLKSASIYVFDPANGAFVQRIEAPRVTLGNQSWQIASGSAHRPGAAPTPIGPTRIALIGGQDNEAGGSRAMPVWALPGAARAAQAAGSSPERFWLRFHRQLSIPLVFVAMTLIAGVLSLGLDRLGGRAAMIAAAASAGLAVHFSMDFAGGLALAGLAPAWAAVWCPSLVALCVALAAISWREDG